MKHPGDGRMTEDQFAQELGLDRQETAAQWGSLPAYLVWFIQKRLGERVRQLGGIVLGAFLAAIFGIFGALFLDHVRRSNADTHMHLRRVQRQEPS